MTKPAWATETWDAGTGPLYTATLDSDCTAAAPNTLEPVRLGLHLLAYYPPHHYPRPLVFVMRSDQPRLFCQLRYLAQPFGHFSGRDVFGLTATEARRLATWLDHAADQLEHERIPRHD